MSVLRLLRIWWVLFFEVRTEADGTCSTQRDRCPGRVIIIGAGLAGLAAAQSLRRAECDVVVLEVHDHVGGRAVPIHHGPFQGLQRGAQWIHGGEQNLVMMALLRFYNISTIRVGGNTEFEGDSERHHLHKDGIDGPLKAKAFRSFEAAKEFFEDEAVRMVSHAKKDISVRDVWTSVLRKRPRSEVELLEWQLRVRSEQAWAEAPELIGLRLAELATYNEFDGTAHGGDIKLAPGGFGELLDKMSEGLAIHLGVEVKSVHFDSTGVSVQTANHTVYKGAAVIVTSSLALLQARHIDFSPGMGEEWYDTLKRFQMGRLAKIFIKFSPGQCPVGQDTYLLSRVVGKDSAKLLYYCIREEQAETVTLICLVGGPSSEAAHGASARGLLYESVMAELQEMYPGISRQAVDHVYFASFVDDPFVLGSWTSGKVGSSSCDFDVFVPKTGRLFFAGEHTCRLMYGTVQAAIVSGARAAQQAMSDGQLSGSSDWPLFDKDLYSLCDELAPPCRQEVCSNSCDKVWQRVAYRVPTYFLNWSGIPAATKTCWEGLGWTESCWSGRSRRPESSEKPWLKLKLQERKDASCVGYGQDLWDAFKEDIADQIICRAGSQHFCLPWDCLRPEMQKDWAELGLMRSMLDEGVRSPLSAISFKELSSEQRSAALRIGYREWLW